MNDDNDSKEGIKGQCDINWFHKVYGHASPSSMMETAKAYGWKLTGKFTSCKDCQISNAQQNAVKKSTKTTATTPGERVFIDMNIKVK